MIDNRKADRRKMAQHVDLDRRLCERRQQIADEAVGVPRKDIEKRASIHLNGSIVVEQ